MRIVVTGAGSGGHVSPVLAVVDALKRRAKTQHSHLEVLYIGRRQGIERELAEAAGLRYVGVAGGKYRRAPGGVLHNLRDWRQTLLNLRDTVGLAWGVLESLYQLWRFKPEVVFNKAGATGLPVGLAARWLGIPMVIHEPDVVPGLANRTLSRWASAVATGFPVELYPQLPIHKLTYTGTPVRSEILRPVDRDKALAQFFGPGLTKPKLPVILVIGGSQGARAINELVSQALPSLLQKARLIHVIGTSNGEVPDEGADNLQYAAFEYLDAPKLATAYAAADLVVSRAGANAIAELASLGKPTVLMPNRVMAAHQQANAEVVAAAGGAVIISDETSVDEFTTAVIELAMNASARRRLSDQIKKFDHAQAVERLADVIEAQTQGGGGAR